MKKRILSFVLILTLIFSFAASAYGYEDYGLVYDDTGLMDTEYMEVLSNDTLADIGAKYGLEVRVDIVSDLEGYTIDEYAELFYEQYEYGYNGNGNCILLMIQLHEDETGLAYDDYYIYTGGECVDIFSGDALDMLTEYLDEFFYAEAWSGDLTQDRTVGQAALDTYAATVNGILLGDEAVAYDPEAEAVIQDDAMMISSGFVAVPGEVPEACIFDEFGLLFDSEYAELNAMAIDVSAKYGCGIYIVVVEDYTAYNSNSVYDAATTIYQSYDLGLGEGKDGVLLLLSMAERDYSLISYGDSANYAFSDYAKTELSEAFLDNFGSDDWYGGFADYITTSEEYIEMAIAGTPMNADNDPNAKAASLLVNLAIIILVPILVAGVVCFVFYKQMKPVAAQRSAGEYIVGSVHYTDRQSRFSHVTETRTPIVKDDDSFSSGGGFSGKSGKF